MTKTKTTKRALLSSVLALFLCFTMLIGTTYAWFTDSVTSAGNVITAGNLDIDVQYTLDGENWADLDGAKDLFQKGLWEPGHTEVIALKITNKGSLALKYAANMNILNEKIGTSKDGKDIVLSEILEVRALTFEEAGVDPIFGINIAEKTIEEAFKAENSVAYGAPVAFKSSNVLDNSHKLLPEAIQYVLVQVDMPETVGNEANAKDKDSAPYIDFGINVLATQFTYEKDSFDNQYDSDADYAVEVKTAEELANALKAGGPVKLANDIVISESLPITKDTVLDLNGKNIGTSGSTKGCPLYLKGGKLTIKNGTLDLDGSETNVHGTFSTAIGYDAQTELVVENVTFTGETAINGTFATNGPLTITVSNSTINTTNVGIAVAGESTEAIATINNCNINAGKYAIFASQGAKITINGGTYKSAENVITSMYEGSVVTVNGGYFEGNLLITAKGALVIKGGTFNVNPSAYVAPGYQVTNNGDGTWTVDEYKVSTGAELVDAIANGKAVELTQDVQIGKIDLTGAITNDVVIDANGHKITTTDAYGIEVTAGKNVTISNANVEMTKPGDYITYAAGFKIANGDYAGATITLENCTITMANTDWAYAVTMPASVKNLNLVIDNCTLEGAVAVQCWGDNNTITITNSKLICNYTTSAQYTSYCVALQGDGTNNSENNTLVIDNCEFLYSGIDNFNSSIYAAKDVRGNTGNTVTVTNCTYGEKVVAG